MNDALLEKERDQLANALERLADVQRELAEGQRSLMTGPHTLHLQLPSTATAFRCNCFPLQLLMVFLQDRMMLTTKADDMLTVAAHPQQTEVGGSGDHRSKV